MKAFYSLFILMLISFLGFSQLNQLDEKGKKHGTWKVYLDQNWKEVKDTNEAVYTRFTHYENGYETTKTGNRSDAILKNQPKNGKELLNGEYKWTDKMGNVKYVDVFDKGNYVSFTHFKDGKKVEETEYSMQWKNEPNTYRMSVIKDDKTEYYWMRKGPKGWMGYSGAADGK